MQRPSDAIREAAVGRWPEILAALGVPPEALRNRHGPCPACGGKDRFRFDDRDRRGTWICNQCGAGDGFALVMRLRGAKFPEALQLVEQVLGGQVAAASARPSRPAGPRLSATDRAARTVWMGARPVVDGDPVDRYLRGRCGDITVPPSIRFASDCRHVADDEQRTVGYFPALVAAFQSPAGIATGIQRLWLTEDGRKAGVSPERGMLGQMVPGGAVRLMPIDGDALGIAEGIETAFSASRLFAVPCWAALDAGRMEVWEPPAGIRRAIIFADNDVNQRGQEAAWRLEGRLMDAGFTTEVRCPERVGEDWNDHFSRLAR